MVAGVTLSRSNVTLSRSNVTLSLSKGDGQNPRSKVSVRVMLRLRSA